MYHFLYISPIKTLISAEIINNVTKNNVTRIYNTEYNTVLANYENAIPIKVSSQTKSFINHNSKDLINSIVYLKVLLEKIFLKIIKIEMKKLVFLQKKCMMNLKRLKKHRMIKKKLIRKIKQYQIDLTLIELMLILNLI